MGGVPNLDGDEAYDAQCKAEMNARNVLSYALLITGAKGTRTVPRMHLLRTKSVVSSLRGTSDRRTYGASTAQIRLGYGVVFS
ncbi:MAG: hypothetical protein ACLUE2_08165 [Bacteroides cellulosilyticus]